MAVYPLVTWCSNKINCHKIISGLNTGESTVSGPRPIDIFSVNNICYTWVGVNVYTSYQDLWTTLIIFEIFPVSIGVPIPILESPCRR